MSVTSLPSRVSRHSTSTGSSGKDGLVVNIETDSESRVDPRRTLSAEGRKGKDKEKHDTTFSGGTRGEKEASSDHQIGDQEKQKGRLKSEKSIKDLAGAIARFWVG